MATLEELFAQLQGLVTEEPPNHAAALPVIEKSLDVYFFSFHNHLTHSACRLRILHNLLSATLDEGARAYARVRPLQSL